MTVPMDTVERMQVWVTLNRPKNDFGVMSQEESDLYDRLETEINEAKAKGYTIDIVAELPQPHKPKK